jgi:small subunit ribosomal protein S16
MVRIRLTRIGSKKQPSYRIVVTDKRNSRDSNYLENIGWYNPRTQPATEVVDEGRALYWLSVGAQPSDAVERIFQHLGTLERFERLKAGEAMEILVQEAEATRGELPSQRTNYPAPGPGESKQKAREAAALESEEGA